MKKKESNMKKRTKIRNVLFGVLVGALVLFSLGAATHTEPRNKTWEYTTHFYGVSHPDIENLNKLGADGWELVAYIPSSERDGNGSGFVFKRPRE
jgi:hypothetical protein